MNRSDGVFVERRRRLHDAAALFTVPSRIAFCQMVLSRVPQRLDRHQPRAADAPLLPARVRPEQPGAASPAAPRTTAPGRRSATQDTWVNVNIADGGHNAFDAPGRRPELRADRLAVRARSRSATTRMDQLRRQLDRGHDVRTSTRTRACRSSATRITDPVHTRLDLARSRARVPLHELRPQPGLDQGDQHRAALQRLDGRRRRRRERRPTRSRSDLCDDFRPLGDPGPERPADLARATATAPAGTSLTSSARTSDTNTLWAATSTGRIFVSKNADNPNPAAVVFDRHRQRPDPPTTRRATRRRSSSTGRTRTTPGSPTAATTRRRRTRPGHVFEVLYVPARAAPVDVHEPRRPQDQRLRRHPGATRSS